MWLRNIKLKWDKSAPRRAASNPQLISPVVAPHHCAPLFSMTMCQIWAFWKHFPYAIIGSLLSKRKTGKKQNGMLYTKGTRVYTLFHLRAYYSLHFSGFKRGKKMLIYFTLILFWRSGVIAAVVCWIRSVRGDFAESPVRQKVYFVALFWAFDAFYWLTLSLLLKWYLWFCIELILSLCWNRKVAPSVFFLSFFFFIIVIILFFGKYWFAILNVSWMKTTKRWCRFTVCLCIFHLC